MKWYDSILTKVKGIFSLSHDASESEIDAALDGIKSHADLKAQIQEELKLENEQAVATAVETVQSDLDTANQTNADLQKQVDDLKAENADLQKQNALQATRITELEKEPAAEHTKGKTETEEGKKSEELWDQNPLNQKARAMRERRGSK